MNQAQKLYEKSLRSVLKIIEQRCDERAGIGDTCMHYTLDRSLQLDVKSHLEKNGFEITYYNVTSLSDIGMIISWNNKK